MTTEPDFSQPLDYERVERAMRQAMHQHQQLVAEYATASDELAVAKAEWEYAEAACRQSLRLEKGEDGKKLTEKAVDDGATTECHEQRVIYLRLDAKVTALRAKLNQVHARQDDLRSLMSSHRIGAVM